MTTALTLLSTVAFRGREITGPRLRGLLALLATDLRAGAGTPRLVDGLWPDEQPDNPTKALQILVSRIRAQLGDGVVARTPTGYRLELTDDDVDAAAVLTHAAAASGHARAHDHAAALKEAETGLALWDGQPKNEGTGDPLAALRTERAVTYRTLVRGRALALARLDRHAEALPALTELVDTYPRDEELLLELLKAEAATHGPAAAMARYDSYRRALRDELGADPGPALRAAHQDLLAREQPTVRHGVAHEPNPLLGRDDDLAAIGNLLRGARVVSIVGPGGLGKTRIAHVVSRQATQRMVQFVGLAGVAADGDVAAEVASALGVGDFTRASGTNVVAGIAEALGSGALLVLDNCEHVLAATADLVAALVATTKDLRVLTTSRAPLGLSSESVYPLPELDERTMAELFGQRARAARPAVDLPADAVAELCSRLDGLPLAVELAAARVRVLSVTEINRRLADRFALLRGGRRDAPERHHTLHAVVDWSWHLLDEEGRTALRALSVFRGGFTAEAADRVLADDVLDSIGILEHLVDQSLLKVSDTPAGARFRMLETVREFGAARLVESGAGDRVFAGFLAWTREFGVAHHDVVFGPDPLPVTEVLRTEQDNLLLALRHGLATGDAATVAATGAVLTGLWAIDGNYVRAASLSTEIAQLLAHHRPAPEYLDVTRTVAAVCALNALAVESSTATRMLVVLRHLPPAPADTPVRAVARVLATPGVFGAVFGADSAVLRGLLTSDEPMVAAVAGMLLGYRAEHDGDIEGAIAAAHRMLAAFDTNATPWLWILSHSRLGELSLRLERSTDAHTHYTAAMRLMAELGGPRDVIGLSWGLALANLGLGRLDEAEHWIGKATEDNAGSPDDLDETDIGSYTFVLAARAQLALARGDVDTGLQLWRRAVAAWDAVYVPPVDTGGDGDDLRPWVLEVQAGAVSAHARFDRLDLVDDLLTSLPGKLVRLLENPLERPPVYIVELPLAGALLLALGVADIATGAVTSGVRLAALAERFQYLRGFHATMSFATVRDVAENADGPAYADAVSTYAGLDRTELRGAALAALRDRATGTGRG